MSLLIDGEPRINPEALKDGIICSDIGKTVFEILAGSSNLEGSEDSSEEFIMSLTRKGNFTVPDESTPPPPRPIPRPTPPPVRPNR